jgi:hypothetical protein
MLIKSLHRYLSSVLYKPTASFSSALFKSFLDHTFIERKKQFNDLAYLIDSSARNIPFQNKKEIILEACETILSATGKDENNRPLLAITRGSGCGKSRLLEEIRLHFDSNCPAVLCSAITFTRQMSSSVSLVKQLNNKKELSLAFSIVIRMLASYYGMELDEIEELLLKFDFYKLIQDNGESNTFIIEELLHSTIKHLVSKQEGPTSSSKIEHFVLAIDESYRSIVFLDAVNNTPDVYYDIRSSLLDVKVAGRIKCHLVMSSLMYTTFIKTPSGRPIYPLDCGVMDSRFVVENIWKKNFDSVQFERLKKRLFLLASATYKIPRLVEFADTSMRTFMLNHELEAFNVDDLIKFICKEMIKKLATQYAVEATALELFPLFFPINVKLNEASKELNVANLVRLAIYTNQLKDLLTDKELRGSMVPEGSLYRVLISNALFQGLMDRIMEVDSAKPATLFKDVTFRWIGIKTEILMEGTKKFTDYKPTIASFFGINVNDLYNQELTLIMTTMFPVPSHPHDIEIPNHSLKNRMNHKKERKQFFKELDDLSRSKSTIILIKSKEVRGRGDCFDMMIVLQLPQQLPIVIFIDMKSASFDKTQQSRFSYRQHSKLKDYLNELPSEYEGSICDSLRQKKYLFLYLTDWEFNKLFDREREGNCYVMDHKNTKDCLTLLFEVYKVARSGSADLKK